MKPELAFVLLFLVATAVAITSRRARIPYTVALVATGLFLGSLHLFHPPHLTKELVYTLCLPGLIFEAAFHLDAKTFWRSKLTVLGLAVPGLIVAILLTAVTLTPVVRGSGVVDFQLKYALVFAALIAATDPIAVVAMFKTLGAPKRLGVLVEAESLLNDGTAVAVFAVLLAFAEGTQTTWLSAVSEFAVSVGMGSIVGAAVGFGCGKLIQRVEDPMIEITLTTIAAYGAFAIAEELHFSGVIATVTSGMLIGNYTAQRNMSPTSRVAVATFWEYVAFALNSIVFLLIGFEVHIPSLLASWLPVLAAWAAVMLARAFVVFFSTLALRKTNERIPWKWASVMTWGGLRGALSMVLALGLAPDFPHRQLLVDMTFGVVTLSLLVQGLTMAPLLRRLRVTGVDASGAEDYSMRIGQAVLAKAALDGLDAVGRKGTLSKEKLSSLRAEYRAALAKAEDSLKEQSSISSKVESNELSPSARREIIDAQKLALDEASKKGLLSKPVVDALRNDLDGVLLSLIQPARVGHDNEPDPKSS